MRTFPLEDLLIADFGANSELLQRANKLSVNVHEQLVDQGLTSAEIACVGAFIAGANLAVLMAERSEEDFQKMRATVYAAMIDYAEMVREQAHPPQQEATH